MNAVQAELLPAGTPGTSHRVARGIGTLLLVGSVLFVLFAGTFPFDFRLPPAGDAVHQIASTFDWRLNPWDPGHVDRKQNIKFFLPFGFSIASVMGWGSGHRRSRRALMRLLVAMVAGAALSSFVEVCQTFVSFRDPSFADVWCNTVGSVFGAAVFIVIGEPCLKFAAKALLRVRPLATPVTLGTALVLYAAIQLEAPLRVRNAGDLSIWDLDAWLVVGNSIQSEATWNGTVSEFVVADRSVDAEQAMELARGAEPNEVLGKSLVALYRPRGSPPYPDLRGHFRAPLSWAKPQATADVNGAEPPPLHEDNWLRTPPALAPVIFRIKHSSQCTLGATAASYDINQRGPDAAPVTFLTIASHARSLNFVLAQDGPDLMVRVRTAVRGMPGLYVRDVFRDTNLHQIAVTVKQAQIVVYIDGTEHGRCEITPEAKMIWRLYPRVGFRLWLDRYGFRSYAAIYRLLVFIPFCALLGGALMTSRLSASRKWVIASVIIVAMALALEAILSSESATGFELKNLVISLIVAFGSLGGLVWWRRTQSGGNPGALLR